MATKDFLVAGQPKLKDKEMDITARGFIYCLTKNQATALYNSMTASHTARDAIDATFHLYHSELSEALVWEGGNLDQVPFSVTPESSNIAIDK